MTERIYIVAGTYGEYKQYVAHKMQEFNATSKLMPQYRYVSNSNSLLGLQTIKGFYIGTYEQRPDINSIRTMIDIIKSKR